MDPYALAFFLVMAFFATLGVAIFLIRRMLRERKAAAAAGQDTEASAEIAAGGAEAKSTREWRRLESGVPRLLELLVSEKTLTTEQAEQVVAEQRRTEEGIG